MKKTKLSWKTIIMSTSITSLILILFIGLIFVELRTRQTGFDEPIHHISVINKPPEISFGLRFFDFNLKLDFSQIYNFTDNISTFIYNLVNNC